MRLSLNLIGRSVAIVLAAAVVPAIVLLSFTPSIIDANAHEIAFNRRALYAAWGLYLIAWGMFAAIALWKPRFLVFLMAWAISIIVWNGLFPHIWLSSPTLMAMAVAAELGLLAASIALLARAPIPALVGIGAIFSVISMVTSAPAHYRLLVTLPGKHDQPQSAHRRDLPPIDSSVAGQVDGNVYHVVMDMFAPQYLTHRLGGDSPPVFDGFTFYPNATSNYGRTNLSMRSVFTGDFHPHTLTDWESAFSEGIVARMRDNNIPMYLYPFYHWYCDASSIVCRATNERYFYDRKHVGIFLVIDIALQSALPLSFRDSELGSLRFEQRPIDTWDYGFSVIGLISGLLEDGEGVPGWRRTYEAFTMDTLEDFLRTEETRPATGQYIYLHMMVPHPPFSFDPDCVYVNPNQHNKKPYIQTIDEQFACAVTVMERIVERLRDLNRFDGSLVIFHADHGYMNGDHLSEWDKSFVVDQSAPPVDRNTGDISAMPSHSIEALASVMFMAHLPGQTDFEVSPAQVQLLDVAPTIMDYFDLPYSDFPGISLIGSTPPSDREKIYFASDSPLLPEVEQLGRFIQSDGRWSFTEWSPVAGDTTQ